MRRSGPFVTRPDIKPKAQESAAKPHFPDSGRSVALKLPPELRVRDVVEANPEVLDDLTVALAKLRVAQMLEHGMRAGYLFLAEENGHHPLQLRLGPAGRK